MAEKDSTSESDDNTEISGLPESSGKLESLEQRRETLYMEVSVDAVAKYKGLPFKKRRAMVKRYKARRWTNADLATLFSVQERTIERDLAIIRKGLWADVTTDDGARELLEEIQADLRLVDDEIVREAWQLFTKTNNDPVKVSCLKLIGDRQADVLKALQSLGMLKKAPQKLEIEGVNVDEHVLRVLDQLTQK